MTPSAPRPVVLGRIDAIRVGAAVTQSWNGRTFVTAAAKAIVTGPIRLGRLGLEGDEQGDQRVHGGPDKAVLLYCAEHYDRWRADGFDVPAGGFFENLTVSGVDESDVCLGDTLQLGQALVQVTQQRRPCRTLSDRWRRPGLPREVERTGRTGWYVRVLTEGAIAAGDELTLRQRLPGSVTAAEANRVMNLDRADEAGIRTLLAAPELPDVWREKLERRLRGELEDDSARLGD